jgi:hypothetical protein
MKRRNLGKVLSEPRAFQSHWLDYIVAKGSDSEYGRRFGLRSGMSYQDFSQAAPVTHYEDIANEVHRMMHGEEDVLWPGSTSWYAKSSGTTNQKSKFIPVNKENLHSCHIAAAWDVMALIYDKVPDAQMFSEKSLLVGGSLENLSTYPSTRYGDISAILIDRMPGVGRPFYTPDFETALLPDWDEKIEKIAQQSAKENVVMIGGVPTWNIVLFRRILEITGKSNLLEVWPNLQAYNHGGVSFTPYRTIFEELIPDPDFVYQEIYNASEGFFAIQDRKTEEGMALLLNHGMFFEFIPSSEWEKPYPKSSPIWEVEVGVNYAIVVTNNAGLWRYIPGDTVKFTSTEPYRIVITGRTKHFINAFGEEVMVANTDQALALACEETGALASEYTVGPVYFSDQGRGGHEWLIEFESLPCSLEYFAQVLDNKLQELNSDYQAKRYKSMALELPRLSTVPRGGFERWLRKNKTMGAQVKMPRLSNDREVLDSVKSYLRDEENEMAI